MNCRSSILLGSLVILCFLAFPSGLIILASGQNVSGSFNATDPPRTPVAAGTRATVDNLGTDDVGNARFGGPVQYADHFVGVTFDVKVRACIAALPSVGGICDARGLIGAHTMATSINVGSNRGEPVTLLLGNATIARARGTQFIYHSNSAIIGTGRASTSIKGNDAVAAFYPGNFSANPQNVTIANLHVDNSAQNTGSIGIYVQTLYSRYENLSIGPTLDIGLKVGGQPGACPCYNTFKGVFTSGSKYGADFSVNTAQNQWYGGGFSGPIGLYMESGINQFFGPDFENDPTAIEFTSGAGGNLFIGPYFEGNKHNVKLDAGAHGNSIIGGSWSGPNSAPNIINNSGATDNFIFTTGSGPQAGGVAPLAFGASTFVVGGNMAYNYDGNGASYITSDGSFANGIDFDWGTTNAGSRLGKVPIQTGWVNASGGLSVRGYNSTASLPDPSAPSIKQGGTAGITSYAYYVVCHDYNGGTSTVSPVGSTSTGNATLSTTNYNIVTYSCGPGWNTADILKGTTSMSLGTGQHPNGTIEDIGHAPEAYTTPTRNTTSDVSIAGMSISQGIRWPLPARVINGASFYCPNCDSAMSPPTLCSSNRDKTGSWVHGLNSQWICPP